MKTIVTSVQDLKHGWLSLARRLQSVAKSNGLSVLSINILVDAEGEPIAWTAPKKVLIEPSNDASEIMGILAGFVEK